MYTTLRIERPGCLFSCINQGLEAEPGESLRIFLIDGKYGGPGYVDAKILTKTPEEIAVIDEDTGETIYREGYIWEFQIGDADLPPGVARLDPCDVKDYGCPSDVPNDFFEADIVTCVQFDEAKQQMQAVMQKVLLIGQTIGAPTVKPFAQGQGCSPTPTSGVCSWQAYNP